MLFKLSSYSQFQKPMILSHLEELTYRQLYLALLVWQDVVNQFKFLL